MNDVSNTDSLLKELENLNQTLSTELRREMNTVSTSAVSAEMPTNLTTVLPMVSSVKLTEENLSEFIFENSQKLVKHSLETIEGLKYIVAGTADGDTMAGYASIIKATSSALDTLNALNLEKQKGKTAKELKLMDIDGRKQIAGSQKPSQTLNLIAPRESIMKMLAEIETKRQLTPAIDAEFVEIKEEPKKPNN